MGKRGRKKLALGMKGLEESSDKMEEIFWFICKYKEEHDGNSPTIREINESCGYHSTSAVVYQLRKMVNYGWLKQTAPIEVVGGKWKMNGFERRQSAINNDVF